MSIFDKLKNPALAAFMQDQNIRELVSRREFRLTEEYFHREFIAAAADDEIHSPELKFYDGYAELRAKIKKKLLPEIPFSARFVLHGVEFGTMGKRVHLKVEQVKPLDSDWVTKRVVARVPFLSFSDGILTCDLTLVPKLAYLFSYQLKGINVADFITLKKLTIQQGEMVGRVGMVL